MDDESDQKKKKVKHFVNGHRAGKLKQMENMRWM